MPKKKLLKNCNKKILKRFSRGSIAFYALIFVVIILSVTLVLGPNFPKTPLPQSTNACLDYDPPDTSNAVQFKGVQYDLIKKDAGIATSKVPEMTPVGQLQGSSVYKLDGANYFGQNTGTGVIYILRSVKLGFTYFDIYLEHGRPIPDYIKKSPNLGGNGSLTVLVDDSTQYPPSGFNATDITNLSMELAAPAYIYGENKTSSAAVIALNGAKKIGTISTSKGVHPLYFHLDSIYLVDGTTAYEYLPTDSQIDFGNRSKGPQDNLQIKKVTLKTISVNAICWYTPECKPAIYLYPEKQTEVNVKVKPKGYFTYTDPVYPESTGWNVVASPDGTITSQNKNYAYLYYESKILNSEIQKPSKGFVVKYSELHNLYSQILPKLGLNAQEQQDFQKYWEKVLPKASYYFVGIMNDKNIDSIEPLKISPQPDKIIRVRLYFEPLNAPKSVQSPIVPQVHRPQSGFTAVEWGGIVDGGPNSTFSCSQ